MLKPNLKRFYQNKRVLVTGGSGFIGSTLVNRLVKSGAIVFTTAREKDPWRLRSCAQDVTLFTVDLTNKGEALKVLKNSTPLIVINAAASIERERSFANLEAYIDNAYGITSNVLTAALSSGVEKFIQFGSIEEYGNTESPFNEVQHEEPISSYALGKVYSTHLTLFANRLKNINATVLRFAATFGPAQNFGMLIPNLIRAGIEGKEFDMNKGEQFRDFLYVEDLVDAVLLAGVSDKSQGEIINIGSGTSRMVKDVVGLVNEAMEGSLKVNFGVTPYRPFEREVIYMDSQKARTLLEWEPHTDLAEAIRKTVLWYKGKYKKIPQQ